MLNGPKDNSNIYIHGTSSAILPLLVRTGFALLPLDKMLERYSLVPMCGELNKMEALKSLKGSGTFISFGSLNAPADARYNLDGIKSSYTKYTLPDVNQLIQDAKKNAEDAFSVGFENINILLVDVARAKELGEDALTKDEYNNLLKKLNGVIQFYYFVSLLGSNIYLDYEAYHQAEKAYKDEIINSLDYEKLMREDHKNVQENMRKNYFPDDVIDEFTYEKFIKIKLDKLMAKIFSKYIIFENIINKITELNLNVKNIVDNPTTENLEKLLPFLELPAKCYFESIELAAPKVSFLSLNSEHPNKDERDYSLYEFEEPLSNKVACLADNSLIKYTFDTLLIKFFEKPPTSASLIMLKETANSRCELLEKKMTILKNIVERDMDEARLDSEELAVIEQSFPVIILCNSSDKISQYAEYEQEYRTNQALRFGEDITMVATDTQEHQLYLKEFFKKHNIPNIDVVLIDNLSDLKVRQTDNIFSASSSFFSIKNQIEIITRHLPENN